MLVMLALSIVRLGRTDFHKLFLGEHMYMYMYNCHSPSLSNFPPIHPYIHVSNLSITYPQTIFDQMIVLLKQIASENKISSSV